MNVPAGGATATHNGNNQIKSDGVWNYFYDDNGNLAAQVGVAGGAKAGWSIDYSYDFRNRLTSVVSTDPEDDVTEVVYTYDMYNRLIARTSTGDTSSSILNEPMAQTFFYDGENMLASTTAAYSDVVGGTSIWHTGNVYFWGPGGRSAYGQMVDQILADDYEYDSTTYQMWQVTDNQGTVRKVLYDLAGVIDSLVYNAYGQLVSESDGTAVDFLYGGGLEYTGQFVDPVTQMQFADERVENQTLGRWMQQDPIFPESGTNPYPYCDNSPTNFTDPDGLDAAHISPVYEDQGIWDIAVGNPPQMKTNGVATWQENAWSGWGDDGTILLGTSPAEQGLGGITWGDITLKPEFGGGKISEGVLKRAFALSVGHGPCTGMTNDEKDNFIKRFIDLARNNKGTTTAEDVKATQRRLDALMPKHTPTIAAPDGPPRPMTKSEKLEFDMAVLRAQILEKTQNGECTFADEFKFNSLIVEWGNSLGHGGHDPHHVEEYGIDDLVERPQRGPGPPVWIPPTK